MSPKSNRFENYVLQHIADNVHCVSCQRHYDREELEVLSRREGTWIVRVACERCGTEGLILVMLENRSDDSQSWPADSDSHVFLDAADDDLIIDFDDEAPSYRTQPITDKEIAEVREFLVSYHGNLSELWEDE